MRLIVHVVCLVKISSENTFHEITLQLLSSLQVFDISVMFLSAINERKGEIIALTGTRILNNRVKLSGVLKTKTSKDKTPKTPKTHKT